MGVYFNEYQQRAKRTDRIPADVRYGELVPLLGIAGEIGTLLADYKKLLRGDDIDANASRALLREELGDILWYVSCAASIAGLTLEAIAAENLSKVDDRYDPENRASSNDLLNSRLLDADVVESEQLPRQFEVKFIELMSPKTHQPQVALEVSVNAKPDLLEDNSREGDDYRYHDVMHLSFIAHLCWSPVWRQILDKKRVSLHPHRESVEDGGRAKVKEEAIVALAFDAAEKHNFFENGEELPAQLLKSVRQLVRGLEIASSMEAEWRVAIARGFEVWSKLRANCGGTVSVDIENRRLNYRK